MKTLKKQSREYLRFKLGGRRGCRVLEGLDEEIQEELIEELASEFESVRNQALTDAAKVAENFSASPNPTMKFLAKAILALRDKKP